MSHNSSIGTIKLAQDLAKLLNNRQGSDVQFRVGGGITDSSVGGETIIDASTAVTLYGHSAILRCRSPYFATVFHDEGEWRRRSGGVIYIPNISSCIFQKVLDYIYTGNTDVKTENLSELIVAAEEMELEELSKRCQAKIIHVLEKVFSGEEVEENETDSDFGCILDSDFSVDTTICKLLIPVLDLAHKLNMSEFFQQLFKYTVNHIETILASPDTRTVFFNKIPIPLFAQILASDMITIEEYNVWELALSVACHKATISRQAVEAHFKLESNANNGFPFESTYQTGARTYNSDQEMKELLSNEQLRQLEIIITPLLPAIRFSFMKEDQYSYIIEMLNYFLPTSRLVKLQNFFARSDKSRHLELPRRQKKRLIREQRSPSSNEWRLSSRQSRYDEPIIQQALPPDIEDPRTFSKIIDKVESWLQLKAWILESNGIEGCRFPGDIRLNLIFRASEHQFEASAFHKHCDYQGATLVIIKSDNGCLFGGVNFMHWRSRPGWSGTTSNFLFALADDRYRRSSVIFPYVDNDQLRASLNNPNWGPVFGFGNDLAIADIHSDFSSYSNLPSSYDGIGASATALAGKEVFHAIEYEVFAISKDDSQIL